ncbi:MAG: NAD(+) diphosphatase [Burkholderiales bacterium]|nr:NAD(+) diphosphatase [Burkholderiales bacterium]
MIAMPFDRPLDFVEGLAPPAPQPGARWFVFRGDRLLVELGPPSPRSSDDPRVPARASWARLPDADVLRRSNDQLWCEPLRTLYLGELAGAGCWAAEVPAEAVPPAGLAFEGLRALFSVLDDASFSLAGRALQLLDWDRNHRHCGRCGALTEPKRGERARVCPACGLAAYPRIAPAVMALVRRERELLLARSPHFPSGMYSALAGFVEPGESLESCVAREVAEEVGVRVSRIRYFASQPWPFPHSLMIAFVCEWAAGDIRPQAGEIEAAAWFDVLQLPKLPSRISIARRLIDHVVGEMRAAAGRPTGAREA